jgi:hypothetical protein
LDTVTPTNRNPDAIATEIEETRADLARTVDLIAERLSPKRAASRGASRVKAGLEGVFATPAPDGETSPYDGQGEREHGIRSVPLPDGEMRIVRRLRKDRVAIAAAIGIGVVALLVWRRRR